MRYLHTSIKKDGVKGLSCEVKSTQVAYLKSRLVTQKENLTFEMPSDGKDVGSMARESFVKESKTSISRYERWRSL